MGIEKKQSGFERATHDFGPYFNSDSRILVLGSFPSIKSREVGFYYGHPTNRFWRLIERKFGLERLSSIEEKKKACREHGIALYDVIDSCLIHKSSDASIKEVVPTNLSSVLSQAQIRRIILNGGQAARLFLLYFPELKDIAIALPSTSAANAGISFDSLCEKWFKYLD